MGPNILGRNLQKYYNILDKNLKQCYYCLI